MAASLCRLGAVPDTRTPPRAHPRVHLCARFVWKALRKTTWCCFRRISSCPLRRPPQLRAQGCCRGSGMPKVVATGLNGRDSSSRGRHGGSA
jgi:hypothetical protein